ncbi:MAG: protein-glutamate O-methyltransferase CheR [Flavobacteriales bacterium]|nr:protein-glutamate O-methyltransferase CheR [Flavobacteriales bacterium]MCB9447816.1 protein-glutamate O-methyltransferase CheR [Flavobacteriales bacterium]
MHDLSTEDEQDPLATHQDADLEIELLMEALFRKYGYDFRGYSKAHIRRRVTQRLRTSGLNTVSQMQDKMLHSPTFAEALLNDFSIGVTEMFRDPPFYQQIRQKVIPLLKTWPHIKIWHAGCSTGEEVYSMAILLKEEGLYDRTQIYATDFNQHALNVAREGIYASNKIKKYSQNYSASGARATFGDYIHTQYDAAILSNSLQKNIVWAHHNLVTDSDFTEAHMVVCRNVLIYFSKELQNKVHQLFFNSLVNGGILCLGNKESLQFTDHASHYTHVDKKQRMYKKIYAE